MNTYKGRKQAALAKIRLLEGEQVTIGRGKGRVREEVTWTVILESSPDDDDVSSGMDDCHLGLREIDSILRKAGFDIMLAFIFVYITFCDFQQKLDKMNAAIEADNSSNSSSKKVSLFSAEEFFKGFGVMIAAAGYNCRGIDLWQKEPSADCQFSSFDTTTWPSIIPAPNFERYMSSNRFKQWRKFIPYISTKMLHYNMMANKMSGGDLPLLLTNLMNTDNK